MERRMTLRRGLLAVGLLLGLVILGTCSNPINLLDTVETEVKIATKKFLVVESVDPYGTQLANPGKRILVRFDRIIDSTTVTASTILFNPSVTWEPDFASLGTTKTLYLEPMPYLEGPATYDVTITKGVKAQDGSELQDDYIWSFSTKSWPAGTVRIDTDGNSGTVEDYLLNTGNVTLFLDRNALNVTGVRIATSESAVTFAALDSFAVSKTNVPLVAGEGERYIYVVFVDDEGNESDPESDRIVRDLYVPTVNAGPDRVLNIASPSALLDASVSDTGSGIASYLWYKYTGTGTVTFGTPTKEDTTISADTDGTYSIRLLVYDKAGRSAYDTVVVVRDTVAPGMPTVVGPAPSTDRTPTWTWTTGGGGAGSYQYKLDSSSWVATLGTTYTPGSNLSYGPHTLYVQEKDAYENWSVSGYDTAYVSPAVVPLWGATGVSRLTDLNWPDYPLAAGYGVYLWTGKFPPETPSYTSKDSLWDRTTTLLGSTKYSWYYVAVDSRARVIYTSDTYTFTTGLF